MGNEENKMKSTLLTDLWNIMYIWYMNLRETMIVLYEYIIFIGLRYVLRRAHNDQLIYPA